MRGGGAGLMEDQVRRMGSFHVRSEFTGEVQVVMVFSAPHPRILLIL